MLSIGDFAQLGQVSARMLRHYDDLGLLRPARVDAVTGYRSYGTAQLSRLHKLLALRDRGFTLEQIGALLHDEPPVEELRGMLKLRHAEIEQRLNEETARLGRVEAHLRALEEPEIQVGRRVVVKTSEPLRVAEAVGTAPDLGPSNITPVMLRLIPQVLDRLAEVNVTAGMLVVHVARRADEADDVEVHGGFDIGTQHAVDTGTVRIVDMSRSRSPPWFTKVRSRTYSRCTRRSCAGSKRPAIGSAPVVGSSTTTTTLLILLPASPNCRSLSPAYRNEKGTHMQMTEPTIEARPERPYVAITRRVGMGQLGSVIPPLLSQVFAWLD